MKLIKDLTAREKTMLYLLSIIVLAFVCLYFLILPTAAQTRELQGALDATRETDAIMRGVLKGADYGAQIAQLDAQIAQVEARRLAQMPNAELDALITGIITKCGLAPHSLTLGQISEDEISAFGGQEDGAPPARAVQNTANAVFSGGPAGFEKFLAEIDIIDAVRVSYVSYGGPQSGGEYIYTVQLAVYMAEEPR